MTDSGFILEMRHVSKSFPGVKALDDVSIKVRPGSIHALMGENGAGKSTLLKCLTGEFEL
ncbi:MAG: ATP-binding cassette domain-containing protein, partial [Spirochaetaceae bacterium]|nr:ATP-binding cassette domain-containing protein [Spirochaetaceae bacterium]